MCRSSCNSTPLNSSDDRTEPCHSTGAGPWACGWLILFVVITSTEVTDTALMADTRPGPNIILLMADDLGWGDVGFNGGKTIRTPALDAMARDGLTFRRFYAAAPVCSPTRGSCLTGRHPFRYGITNANVGHMLPEERTLAELLKPRGYLTGHFGKWHLGTLTTEVRDSNRGGPNSREHFAPPWKHGFDVCFSTEAKVPTFDPLIRPKVGARPIWWDPVEAPADGVFYGTRYWDHHGKEVTENISGDDSRVIMDRVIPFIREATQKNQPFLSVVWFHAPHLPVVAGKEHADLYPNTTGYQRNYYGCVSALDDQVGRLRAELKRLEIEQDTMIWFCSDNGPEGQSGKAPGVAGQFRGRKRDLYEGGVRVPGVLVWPSKVKANTQTDYPAVTSDYVPTILRTLEVPYPDDRPLDGVDLWPVIEGKTSERTTPIGFRHGNRTSLMAHRHKLIRVGENRPWELYDLIADPGEKTDLATKLPEVVAQMKQELQRWEKSVDRSRTGADYQPAK